MTVLALRLLQASLNMQPKIVPWYEDEDFAPLVQSQPSEKRQEFYEHLLDQERTEK